MEDRKPQTSAYESLQLHLLQGAESAAHGRENRHHAQGKNKRAHTDYQFIKKRPADLLRD